MNDKIFVDTNIWIYLFSDDKKSKYSRHVIDSNFDNIIVSTQVLNELFNVIAIKHKLMSKTDAKFIIKEIMENFYVSIVNTDTILKAIDLSNKYQLSYFDSLMIASALLENCSKFYSEDMHNGLLIENKFKIKNPLVS